MIFWRKKKETPTLFLEFISEKLVRENCVNFITLEKINWRNKAEKTTGELSVLENIVGGTKRRKKTDRENNWRILNIGEYYCRNKAEKNISAENFKLSRKRFSREFPFWRKKK